MRRTIETMLEHLEISDPSVVSRSEFRDGYNYVNDHSPTDSRGAVDKIERFISFGGTMTEHADHLQVAWQAHSEGELLVYRLGEDSYFVHGWIEFG